MSEEQEVHMSTLVQKMRSRLPETMKDPTLSIEKDVLRLVLGEVQLLEGSNKPAGDTQVEQLIRKTIEGNKEMLAHLPPTDDRRPKLEVELGILERYLPKTLSEAEILEQLTPLAEQLKGAKSDGAATGMAMGHFKKAGLAVTGQEVGDIVKRLRS
jgi:uncharacterized protein YqeY